MPQVSAISRFVTAVFLAWRQGGIDFLVLRNYESLPDFTANDIDVLIAPTSLAAAEHLVLEAARESGFRLHNRAQFATLALYFSREGSCEQAHFDLFTGLKWRGFDFLDCEDFLKHRIAKGLFSIPHPAHEAATNLLAHMIYTGKVKEKYKPTIAAGFRTEPSMAIDLLARTYGAALARSLVEPGAHERWAEMEATTGVLRRALVLRQLTLRPLRTLRSFTAQLVRLTKRFLSPPGLVAVLCGPDGSGKSTAGPAIAEGLQGTFSPLKGRYYHWKPPLFSTARRSARPPTSNPHNQVPRGRLVSLVFFGYHWLEFFLGMWTRIRPLIFRGGLVLIDRFYYDFFVDQRRYRLNIPQALVRFGYLLLPKPDLVLLLDAPVEVLQSRKAEVPPPETHRQRLAYLQLVQGLPQGRIIDAFQPPDKVASDMVKTVLEFMAQRTSKRLGLGLARPADATLPVDDDRPETNSR